MHRISLLCALLLVAGCHRQDGEEPPLVVDVVEEAPRQAVVQEATRAGLTARDSEGRVVPGIARSWRVADDGHSIVFRLRDAEFRGGRRIKGADVVAALQQARNGGAGPLIRDMLAGVTGVSAPLETVVEIRLSTPQPELLELLAIPALHIRPPRGAGSAGPFFIEPQAKGAPQPAPTALRRNPGWFDADAVQIAHADVQSFAAETAIARFNRGESALVLGGRLDGLGIARVTARRETLVLSSPRAALMLLVNQNRAGLSEPGVRRALLRAIDRDALGPALFGTQSAQPVTGLLPPDADMLPIAPADWAGQPLVVRQEEARRLLAEAGFGMIEKRLKLEVLAGTSAIEGRLVERVARDLAAVGVDVVLRQGTAAGQARVVTEGNFDLALVRRESPIASAIPFLLPNRCNANRHGLCLPEADRLLAESWKAPTLKERTAALVAAERLWAEDGAVIGLVQPVDWALVSPRVGGFAANPAGIHPLRLLELRRDRRLLPQDATMD